MNDENRIDEVSQYYAPINTFGKIVTALFWLIATISLILPYAPAFLPIKIVEIIQAAFICTVCCHFVLSQMTRFYLLPRAERKRRKQLLSNAFGTKLIHDETHLYYNNQYIPSVQRLGANTMENAFFSREISGKMLIPKRIISGLYMIIWIFIFALPHTKVEILIWITQLIFSAEIIAQWLTLELLHFSYVRTYDELHGLFLHNIKFHSPNFIASVLDSFASYESAKYSAGFLLSSKVFDEMNKTLTKRWNRIKKDLQMDIREEY